MVDVCFVVHGLARVDVDRNDKKHQKRDPQCQNGQEGRERFFLIRVLEAHHDVEPYEEGHDHSDGDENISDSK